MKKSIVALICCTLLACSIMTTTVSAATPTVRLPSQTVYMQADYGTQYWFDITLTEVPQGQDITNGDYHGWCVQKDMKMSSAPHSIKLKSSYDFENLSSGFQNIGEENWNKINYIINHRDGFSRNNTQMAIWNITDNVDLTNYTDSQLLIDAADDFGSDYTPTIGEKLAIPLVGVSTIQLAFLELTIPGFEGLVWKDTTKNGLQNSNEQGKSGVTVRLYTSEGNLSKETTTNSQGKYIFENVLPGEYYLQFILPNGYAYSVKDAGEDDSIDSDADNTGKTIVFTVHTTEETITIWDAGIYEVESEPEPTPPEDEQPSSNIRPTADASAGEPYRGYINQTITFNGSESYDQDGRIISYHWNFGDGSEGIGETTTHVYTIPGDYNVTLQVTDDKFANAVYPTIAHITSGNTPPAKPTLTGPSTGDIRVSYQYTVTAIDPDEGTLRYIINWGDNQDDISPVVASGQSYQFMHQWTTPGFYQIQAYANDTENNSEIISKAIAIGVKYVGNYGYLIDENGDGTYDQFNSNTTQTQTPVKPQDPGKYLLDSNDDGTYDLLYDSNLGTTQTYSEQPILMYLIVLLAILVIVGLFIFYMLRRRRQP